MIMEYFSEIGAWAWFLIGFALLIVEIFMPGAFMIWFGLAALTVGLLSFTLFARAPWWEWHIQGVVFGFLSLIFALVGSKLFPPKGQNDDAARINDPLSRFIGQEGVLSDPIENGAGRLKLGDTTWRIRGDNLPSGTKVRITGHDGSALLVEEYPA